MMRSGTIVALGAVLAAIGCDRRTIRVGDLSPADRMLPLVPGTAAEIAGDGAVCSGLRCTWSEGQSTCDIAYSTAGSLVQFSCTSDGLAYACDGAPAGYVCAWLDDDPTCGDTYAFDRRRLGRLCGDALARFRAAPEAMSPGDGGTMTATTATPANGSSASRSGDGSSRTELRALSGFTEIRVASSFGGTPITVQITTGGAFSVTVTADENVLPMILTRVNGATLAIDHSAIAQSSAAPRVAVVMPSLDGIVSSGADEIAIDATATRSDLAILSTGAGSLAFMGHAATVVVVDSGAGDVTLSGDAQMIETSASGLGSVLARGLTAVGGTIADYGTGNVTVTFAGGEVQLTATGSGNIDWWGMAHVTQSAMTGTGHITSH